MEGNILLLLLIIVPIAIAPIAFFLGKKSDLFRQILSIATIGFVLSAALALFIAFDTENVQVLKISMDYPLSLELDGFRAIHVLLASFLWVVTAVFSKEYFKRTNDKNKARYTAFNLLTLGAVIGVFLSANLFTLFIFFEIMSFTSYGWVVHNETSAAKKAGETYLAVSVIAGMVMLMGLFMLNNTLGTLELSKIGEAVAVVDKSTVYVAGALLLIGFGAKAGMYPLHFWMPKAYPESPAPATALLSGILSKVGVYGIIVISSTAFLHDEQWGMALLILGIITMFWGGICALFSADMKRIITFSSMSQIGFILVGIGLQGLLMLENALAVRGTLLHMLNHSVVKLILFTLCGIIFMNLGTHKLNDIKGYARKNPIFGASFIVAMCGICGIPFFSGYISKTLLHESIIEYRNLVGNSFGSFAIEWIFLISGGLTVAYMIKIAAVLFSSEKSPKSMKKQHSLLTSLCIILPSLIVLIMGVLPYFTADKLANMGQGIMYGQAPAEAVNYFSLENLFGASISILIGLTIYFVVVRKSRKDSLGQKTYSEVFAPWFDLENILYRPIIFIFFPKVLGKISLFLDKYVLLYLYSFAMFVISWSARIVANLTDGVVEVLVLVGLKPAKEKNLGGKKVPAAYKFGTLLDKTAALVSKKPRKGKPFADVLSKYEVESAKRRRMIAGSLSYGLLFAGIGLVIVMLYLLYV